MGAIAWILAVTLISAPATAPAGSKIATADDAAAGVRAFEREPELRLTVSGGDAASDQRAVWHARSADGRRWTVDAASGLVVSAVYPQGTSKLPPATRVSAGEMEKLARTYAETHFPGFLKRVLRVRVAGSDNVGPVMGHLGPVVFEEYLPVTSALTGNSLSVDVDEVTGEVTRMSFHDGLVPSAATQRPAVNRELAIALGARAARTVRINRIGDATLRVQFGRLIWALRLHGNFGNGLAHDRWVEIDAQSGLVLGLSSPRSFPELEAMENQCVVGRGWEDIHELSLRPRRHNGRLWMPADFARIFDLRPSIRGDKAAMLKADGTVAAEVPVERLGRKACLPAEDVLNAARADAGGVDVERCALTVSVEEKAILARIVELRLGQPLKPLPMPPWPAPVDAPARPKQASQQPPTQSQLEAVAAAAAEAARGTKPDSVARCDWLAGLRPGRPLRVMEFHGEDENQEWARLIGRTVVLDAGSGEVLGVAGTGLFLNVRKANPAP